MGAGKQLPGKQMAGKYAGPMGMFGPKKPQMGAPAPAGATPPAPTKSI